jgi:osmotically-inducible protein OsmY
MTRTDTAINSDVVSELRWDPSLRDDDIAVGVRDGVVTLAGYVDSLADKWMAEDVAGSVSGVRAVANDLEVKLPASSQRPDPEIARAALDTLKWNISVPHNDIRVKVEHGWVTLEGAVTWFYQKEMAERAIRHLTGVKGVDNEIEVRTATTPTDVKRRITEALQRGAQFDADRITVEVDDHTAVLRGTVRSFAEVRDAERAARNAPGVTKVDNLLTVDPRVYTVV